MTLDGIGWIVILCSMSNLFHKDEDKSGNLFEGWSYTKKNYIFFICGVIMIILGYIIMITGETNSFQSLSLAPIILTIGYLVLIQASLIYREKK